MLPPADLLVVAFRFSQIVRFFTRGLKHAAEECGPENCHTATAQLTLMDEKAIKIPDHFLIFCSLLKKTEETKWREQERERIYCVVFCLSFFTHCSYVSTDDKQYWKYSFVILDWQSKGEPAGKNWTSTKIHLHLLEQVSLKKCSQQIKSADIIQKIQQTQWQRLLNSLESPLSSWNFNESFLPFFILPPWIIKIKYFNISKCSVSKYIRAHEPPPANEYTKPRRGSCSVNLHFNIQSQHKLNTVADTRVRRQKRNGKWIFHHHI